MRLSITGHRPQHLGGFDNSRNRCLPIKKVLETEFFRLFKDPITRENLPGSYLFSGMALGVDQWAVEVALELGLRVTAVVPCLWQESKWPPASQEHYQRLLKACHSVIQVSDQLYDPALKQMQKRNEALVDACELLLAVWDGAARNADGKGSGTYHCVLAAKRKHRQTLVLNPTTLEVREHS